MRNILFAAGLGAAAILWQAAPASAAPFAVAKDMPQASSQVEEARYRGRRAVGRPYVTPYAWRYGAPRYRRYGYVRPYSSNPFYFGAAPLLAAPFLGFGWGYPAYSYGYGYRPYYAPYGWY